MGREELSRLTYSGITLFPICVCPNNSTEIFHTHRGLQTCTSFIEQADRECDCSAGECKACDRYIEQLEETLESSAASGRVGACFIEPIQVPLTRYSFSPCNFVYLCAHKSHFGDFSKKVKANPYPVNDICCN